MTAVPLTVTVKVTVWSTGCVVVTVTVSAAQSTTASAVRNTAGLDRLVPSETSSTTTVDGHGDVADRRAVLVVTVEVDLDTVGQATMSAPQRPVHGDE